jgi:hypothetical protein
MKKIIRLTESELTNLIKKMVVEANLEVDPYVLSVTPNKNIRIRNTQTGKIYNYKMSVYKLFRWWGCTVHDFPGGNKIKLEAAGDFYTQSVDKDELKKVLQTNFGKQELVTTFGDVEIKFEKIS